VGSPGLSTRYHGPPGCAGAGRVRVRVGGLRVREGGVRIGVGGGRVGDTRVRGGEAPDGRIGTVGWETGVPDAPSGLSSGVHCLNVTRLP